MAALAAVFLSVVGCTVPLQSNGKSGNNHDISLPSPSPTPSPSPSASVQAFAVNGPAFHPGEVGLVYTPVTYTATGGTAPYSWTLASGALPPGLNLTNGVVTGTPTASGTFSATIGVADSGASKLDIAASITVASALSASLIPACAKSCNVELGCVNACGKFGTQTGGIGPFTYQLTQGQLPSGTSLSALSLTGTFTGLTGFLQFTVQVTDGLGGTATVSPTFWMYPHISLIGGRLPSNQNQPCWWTGYSAANAPGCKATFPYSGGTPNAGIPTASASWTSYSNNCYTYPNPPPTTCNPPPMPSITVSGGVVTVTVGPGGSYWSSGYTGVLTITLGNRDTCSAGPTKCAASAQMTITQQGS